MKLQLQWRHTIFMAWAGILLLAGLVLGGRCWMLEAAEPPVAPEIITTPPRLYVKAPPYLVFTAPSGKPVTEMSWTGTSARLPQSYITLTPSGAWHPTTPPQGLMYVPPGIVPDSQLPSAELIPTIWTMSPRLIPTDIEHRTLLLPHLPAPSSQRLRAR